MEVISFLSVMVVVLFFSGTLTIGVLAIVSGLAWKPIQKKGNLEQQYSSYLIRHFPYYKKLTNEQRKEFEHRLSFFLSDKIFIARQMDSVTEEMKIMIGACAIQLTFGLKPMRFAHFNKIIVYPSSYYSPHSRKLHKGEVNPNGIITFAWDAFQKGYDVEYDGQNLGLHEMAHALRLEDATDKDDYKVISDSSLSVWHKVSLREIKRIKQGKKTFLRQYATSDPEEFFAVCVEEFFEQPYFFRRELPEVYQALANLLNQDPTQFYRSVLEEDEIKLGDS